MDWESSVRVFWPIEFQKWAGNVPILTGGIPEMNWEAAECSERVFCPVALQM